MVGERIGGVNVFGGGLALYNSSHAVVGGLGVSGDTSCADHNIAYRTRATLMLDYLPGGVSGDTTRRDNIVFDITPQGDGVPLVGQMPGVSAGGFGHASCHGYSLSGNAAAPYSLRPCHRTGDGRHEVRSQTGPYRRPLRRPREILAAQQRRLEDTCAPTSRRPRPLY